MAMKKIGFAFLILAFFSCSNNKDIPNVSDVKVDITTKRFEQDLFTIDSNDMAPGLNKLYEKYPVLTPIFFQNILGLDSSSFTPGLKSFLSLTQPIYESVNSQFRNFEPIQKEFQQAFRFVKYYFPDYQIPEIVTVVGPLDALATLGNDYIPDFLGPDFLGVSLQFYLGKDFPAYNDPYFVENVVPQYRSRRFSKEYIVPESMKLIVDDLFPDKSNGRPLIEQMIEKGKQWYLLNKFLPKTADSLKTGYTQRQLEWCNENEALIWSILLKNENLNSIDPVTIQTYIGEGPFTQGFSQENSPGNLGQWIGWQIVKKFAEKNPEIKPQDIMLTDARKILEEAKYKPK
jgi:hypothetical protein